MDRCVNGSSASQCQLLQISSSPTSSSQSSSLSPPESLFSSPQRPFNLQTNQIEALDLHASGNNNQTCEQQTTNNNAKNKKLFPQKLWDLINDDAYSCLRWSQDGQLVYLDREEFEETYLKTEENQFHTHKSISFVRQMNMYGFRKVDDCYYENDNFKRDCEHLLKNMIRKHPTKTTTNQTISMMQTSSRSSPLSSPFELNKKSSSTFQASFAFANPEVAINPPQTTNPMTACDSLDELQQRELINALLLAQQQQQQQQHHDWDGQQVAQKSLCKEQTSSSTGTPTGSTSSRSSSACDELPVARQPPAIEQANNLNNFIYALLSLNSGSLYQGTGSGESSLLEAQQQQQLQQQQNAFLELARHENFQQLYQTFLGQQQMNSIANLTNSFQMQAANPSSITSDQLLPLVERNNPRDRQENFMSRLNGSGSREASEEEAGCGRVQKYNKKPNNNSVNKAESLMWPGRGGKQRAGCENKTNRLFKRSIDSILDSNNNNNNLLQSAPSFEGAFKLETNSDGLASESKRIKLEPSQSREQSDEEQAEVENNLNKFARNLVTEVALAKDVKLNQNVLEEASKYTRNFVGILFDTAQVIARHSTNGSTMTTNANITTSGANQTNGSNANKSSEANQKTRQGLLASSGDEIVGIRRASDSLKLDAKIRYETDSNSDINLTDLSSAVRLLPSKLSKILN